MKTLTWQAVVLLAVLSGAAVALAALTTMTPEQIIALVAVLAGVAGGSFAGQAAAQQVQGRVDQIHAETASQTETLATIERRTNGELDARISAGMQQAAQDGAEAGAALVLRELAAQGVIETPAVPAGRASRLRAPGAFGSAVVQPRPPAPTGWLQTEGGTGQ